MNKFTLFQFSILVVFILYAPFSKSFAEEKNNHDSEQRPSFVEIKKAEFSLMLPAPWTEIPKSALASMQNDLRQKMPNTEIPEYDYGFQRENTSKKIEYPYILVQVLNTGRIPEHQLQSFPKLDLNKGLEEILSGLPEHISNASVSPMLYDEDTHIVWSTIQSNISEEIKISALSGMVLTKKGYITMFAYSQEDSFQLLSPLFKAIIETTVLNDELSYKFDADKGLSPLSRILSKALIGGIVGGVVVLLLNFFSNKKKKEKRVLMKLSHRSKKYIYGTIVIVLWLTTEVLIKNSGITLGAVPYTAIMIFWLWMFSKAIGRNFWNWKQKTNSEEIEEVDKDSLMKLYKITKNKDETYSYANKVFECFDEALNTARSNKAHAMDKAQT